MSRDITSQLHFNVYFYSANDEQVQGWQRIKLMKKNTEEIMMFPKMLLTKRHLRSLVKLTNQKSMNHVSKLLQDKQ